MLLHGNRGISDMSGSYNAVSRLLDGNIDEGRGQKLALTDTVSELTCGQLQQQSCRLANRLRRMGVRGAGRDDHARHSGFSDWPVVMRRA
jgi:acyl-coenzyme A synthetase/AMP-(fatty) acid ligase